MKNFSPIYKICLFVGFCFLFSSCLTQKEKENRMSLIDSLVKNNSFKFVAQRANPLRGAVIDPRILQLDGAYYLKINKDTLKCYLPYFGVAQSAPYGLNDNGIQLTTTEFTYDKKQLGKSFDISIVPKNTDKASRLFLSITETGSATLNVTSNTRDAISFTGTIEKP